MSDQPRPTDTPGCRRRELRASDPYTPAWHDYWRKKRLSWILLLGFLPAVLLLGTPFARTWGSDAAYVVVAVPFVIALFVASQRFYSWSCPRCGKPFFNTWRQNQWTSRCLHCQLPKWAPSDPGD